MAKSKIYDVTATGTTEPRDIRDRFSDVINVKDFGAVGRGYRLGITTSFTDNNMATTIDSITRVSEAIDPF